MIRIHRWAAADEHRAGLLAAIERHQLADPGSRLGAGTGWSGPKTLLDEPEAAALRAFLLSLLPDTEASGWGNVMRAGECVMRHEHVRSHLGGDNEWAGVYYVAANEGPGGELLLLTTRPGWPRSVRPAPGRLVLFPAELEHEVAPHRSDAPRVSIGVNFRRARR